MSSTTAARALRTLRRRQRPLAALTACSLVGADTTSEGSKDVVLVTHDSFVLPKRADRDASTGSPATTWSSTPPATAAP